MKSVLISIRPDWCAKIARGEKTLEIRKTRPKLETPFRCYIYCTLPPRNLLFKACGGYEYSSELIRLQSGKIVYDYGMRLACEEGDYSRDNFLCRKVIGEFTCDYIKPVFRSDFIVREDADKALEGSCLLIAQAKKYLGESLQMYAWHISQLKIYDRPKSLAELWQPCDTESDCGICLHYDFDKKDCTKKLKRAPQSWCYVEE